MNISTMNSKAIYILLITLIIILSIVFTIDVSAQPGLPDGPDQAPIDGGLSILAAAGGVYALKKIRDRKKT